MRQRRRPWVARPRDEMPLISPRSRLLSLEPLAIGTPDIEGLTGYVTRLAQEHCVPTGLLVNREIPGVFGRSKRRANGRSAPAGFWRHGGHAINGTGMLAHDAVQTLSDATCRSDLHNLTLLPWTDVLPSRELLRLTRAWCPWCYRDWREGGDTAYVPLLWSIAAVTVCHRHRVPLLMRCPHPGCGYEESAFVHHSLVEHCSRCGGWLGRIEDAKNPVWRPDDIDRRVWEAEAIGALLAIAPTLVAFPRRECIAETVGAWVALMPKGNVHQLARVMDQPVKNLQGWEKGKHLPALPALLDICRAVGASPLHVLVPDRDTPQPTVLLAMSATAAVGDEQGLESGREQASLVEEKAALGEQLTKILATNEYPPPSWKEVARRLGHNAISLKYQFPDLARIVVARCRAYQESKMEALREQLESFMTCEDTPPVSMLEVTRLLGYKQSKFLYHRFPELTRAISARHHAYVGLMHARRIEDASVMVRQVMHTLHEQGIYPSKYKVQRSMDMRIFYEPELVDVYGETLRALEQSQNRD